MFNLFLGISSLLSYISVYQPLVFSRNIIPLNHSTTRIWVFICMLTLSFSWTWYGLNIIQYLSLMLIIQLLLIQIAFIDAYSKIIPNRLLLSVLFLTLVHIVQSIETYNWVFVSIFSLGLIGVQVTIIQLLKRKVFGWGDIKLLIVLSLLYQSDVVIILLGGIFLGGLYSILLVLYSSENRKKQVPLSPFFIVIIPLLSEFSASINYLFRNSF
jgi:leader peptidase (prepilin peptidase)/N-methyltransferase